MNDEPFQAPHRWLFERIPGVCLIETDPSGVITHFGPAAERFFNCSAEDTIGRVHYESFHDTVEMETCRDDPAFREIMARQGWSEDEWTVVPREGKRFQARVTLVRKGSGGEGAEKGGGWIALYCRVCNEPEPRQGASGPGQGLRGD